jgi:hypothetical protein
VTLLPQVLSRFGLRHGQYRLSALPDKPMPREKEEEPNVEDTKTRKTEDSPPIEWIGEQPMI